MTRRDYAAIAAALLGARRDQGETITPRLDLSDHNRGVSWAAKSIADVMARDNPRFDRARFLAACGVQS